MSKELNHLAAIIACLCWGFEFYEVKKIVIIFQKENGNTFTLLIIFKVKSLQKEQNSTNLLLWPPICRNKPAITPKWFNSLDTNSIQHLIPKTTNPECSQTYLLINEFVSNEKKDMFSLWWSKISWKSRFFDSELVFGSSEEDRGLLIFVNWILKKEYVVQCLPIHKIANAYGQFSEEFRDRFVRLFFFENTYVQIENTFRN